MNKKKILLFETSSTLARAYELVLKGSNYMMMRINDPAKVAMQIDIFNPDIIIAEKKSLPAAALAGITRKGIPLILSVKYGTFGENEEGVLSRPFSSEELLTVLNTASIGGFAVKTDTSIKPDINQSNGFGEDEEPVVIEPLGPEEEFFGQEPILLLPAEQEPEIEPEPESEQEIESEPVKTPVFIKKPVVKTASDASVLEIDESDLIDITASKAVGSVDNKEYMADFLRQELRAAMKEYFWEEAPVLIRDILEKEIKKLSEEA